MKPMPSLYSGLQAYWPLHEASGTRFEVSGNGLDLTDNNTVTGNPGRVENASQFVIANSEYLSRASEARLQTGDIDFTWCAWVYLDAVATVQIFVGKDGNVAGQREYDLAYLIAAPGPGFVLNVYVAVDTVKGAVAAVPGAATARVWYFLQGWHDAVNDLVWIQVDNNAPSSLATGGALQAASDAEFDLGRIVYTGAPNYMGGRLCEVGFWRRVLTLQERMWLWNRGMGRTYPFDGRISPIQLNRGNSRRNRRVGMAA